MQGIEEVDDVRRVGRIEDDLLLSRRSCLDYRECCQDAGERE